jgi:hypothetical protein
MDIPYINKPYNKELYRVYENYEYYYNAREYFYYIFRIIFCNGKKILLKDNDREKNLGDLCMLYNLCCRYYENEKITRGLIIGGGPPFTLPFGPPENKFELFEIQKFLIYIDEKLTHIDPIDDDENNEINDFLYEYRKIIRKYLSINL